MRHTYVHPTGPREATIAIVGDQPGTTEVRWRPKPTPFVGPAGKALDGCLYSVGINRRDVYLTNVIKDLDSHLNS